MIIYAAFPGTGKTYIAERNPDVLDSDSSKFKTPDWPKSYLDHIEQEYKGGEHSIIFCSTHKEVLSGLEDRKIPYILIYPDYALRHVYIDRYRRRGSSAEFIRLMDTRWRGFMRDLRDASPLRTIILLGKEYISDHTGL